MNQPDQNVLSVRGLTVRFGALTAVNKVSFDAKRGQLFEVGFGHVGEGGADFGHSVSRCDGTGSSNSMRLPKGSAT